MGSTLRATVPPRRWTAVLFAVTVILAATISHAIELTAASAAPDLASTSALVARPQAPSRARVLLIGDSVLDQQGSAAAFLLRQSGVEAKAVGLWGSGLLTVDQYDNGRTKLSGTWLHKAKTQIAAFRPDVVGVYLNHNYWPPFPHDANGDEITDLWSRPGQRMIAQQARALITILRAEHARVFFISPIPAGTTRDPDPAAWSAIWHGYLPVLQAMHVPIADTAVPLEGDNGLRAETKVSCTGELRPVRPPGDIHLTRFGAGRAGSELANFVANLVSANLHGNAAPGEDTAALVPTPDGRGYWLVGCDGSVYPFGDAPHLDAARTEIAGHRGVTAAVSTPTGGGLWLVAADGTIANVGDAPALTLAKPTASPITSAAAMPGGHGLWATTRDGRVLRAGSEPAYGDLASSQPDAPVVDIAATHSGHGYWLVTGDGTVSAFGDARTHGSAPTGPLDAPIVGIAATTTDGGYWLARSDGRVLSFGDAHFQGAAVWQPRPYPYSVLMAAPGPTVGIVAAPGAVQGYWTFGTTGRVVPRGAVQKLGGDNNLALLTQ